MNYTADRKAENRDRIKSAAITAIVWSAILLFVFFYSVQKTIEREKETVSTMLVNFGDNREGNGPDEPAPREGSLAAESNTSIQEETVSETKSDSKETIPTTEQPRKKESVPDKIISGNNSKMTVAKNDRKPDTRKSSPSTTKTSGSTSKTSNAKTGNGDGKGTAAIGNLLKGKGTSAGTQGNGGKFGNAGDPLGGAGNGDSKIGTDRRLTGFIPGTMGRGGAQPSHKCTASGTITIAYTVDKAGNVVKASRISGLNDPCAVSTTISWVKKYVKAERASVSSTGTYKITF